VAHVRGTRLTDLAFNMIEIIDRNLYERSCDVRWWATDAAVVDALEKPSPEICAHASKRLGVILDSYTVYLDLWVADRQGNVIANGRPQRYPNAVGTNVSNQLWFTEAMASRDGTCFSVADISQNSVLGSSVATYSAAIRRGGENNGLPIGVLGIFFDWQNQSQTVVDNVRLLGDEKNRTTCYLLDSGFKIIASSAKKGILQERYPITIKGGETMGNYINSNGAMVGYALTPGYETYQGLGWYGVIEQRTH